MSANELIKETQHFEHIFQMSRQYNIWYDDDRKVVEDYVREDIHSALGREFFKIVPKDRKLITLVHELIEDVDSDVRRLKTYRMTISIVILEIK